MLLERGIRTHIREAELFITDWSGVISDDRLPVYKAMVRLLAHYQLPHRSYKEWLDLSHSSAYAFLSSQGATAPEEEIMALYAVTYGQVCAEGEGPTVYPDAHSFLSAVRKMGKQIVVVSSHPYEHLFKEAKQYGLHSLIDSVMGGHHDKVPAIQSLLGRTGVRAWYVGDTIYDVRAAREAGLPVVSITTGYHTPAMLEKEKPDLLVNSLTELLQHME